MAGLVNGEWRQESFALTQIVIVITFFNAMTFLK